MIRILCTLAVLLAATFAASANKLDSVFYGQWELYAWQNQNRFCALKSTLGGGSMQVRLANTTNPRIESDRTGYTLVIHDPSFFFENYAEPVIVSFDHRPVFSLPAYSFDSTNNQLFIYFGYDRSFLEWFQAANTIQVDGPSVAWNFGLQGTRLLGSYLDTCVRNFGF